MFRSTYTPWLATIALSLAGCGQEWEVEAQPAGSHSGSTQVSSSSVPAEPPAREAPGGRGSEEAWNSGEGRHVAVDALEWGLLVLD
jgi:hypothetical protein